jgi:hypothetical protein
LTNDVIDEIIANKNKVFKKLSYKNEMYELGDNLLIYESPKSVIVGRLTKIIPMGGST